MRIAYIKSLRMHIDLDAIALITDLQYERKITNRLINFVLSYGIYIKGISEPIKVLYDLVKDRDYRFSNNDDSGIFIRQFKDGEEIWTYVNHPIDPISLDRSFVPVLTVQHDLDDLLQQWKGEISNPIPMLLFCPQCSFQHIDEPNELSGWTNPPHRSHECQNCKHVWRPADVFTTGVAAIKTKGKLDGSAIPNLEV